jgi:tetratricopeptide (TPR) repeat protein
VRQATQLNYLAWVHNVPPGDPEAAMSYANQALDPATRSGATAQIAWARAYAGGALRNLQRFGEAAESIALAAETFKAVGDMDAYCQCLTSRANCFREDGRLEEALEMYREACALVEDKGSGMTPDIAALTRPYALGRLGECLRLLGRRAEAITALTEAIALMDQLQLSDYRQAYTLEVLAGSLAEEGRTEESRRAYARAAEVFEAIGDAEASSRCHDLATTAP